jgi:hypothetical protein
VEVEVQGKTGTEVQVQVQVRRCRCNFKARPISLTISLGETLACSTVHSFILRILSSLKRYFLAKTKKIFLFSESRRVWNQLF